MAAASSSDQCHNCKASGHFKRDCPNLVQNNRSNRGKKKGKNSKGGDPSPKWYSYHKAATQSDEQCHKQKEVQQLAQNLALLGSSQQRFVNIESALLAQTLQPEPQLEPQTFGFSFNAVGASLDEAIASSATSESARMESAGNPAAPTTLVLQLEPATPE